MVPLRTTAAAVRAMQRTSRNAVRPSARLCKRTLATITDSGAASRLLDESIMEHLVCPISKLPLRYDAARGLIICPEIRVAYPIVDGVPMLVPTEGRLLRDDEEA